MEHRPDPLRAYANAVRAGDRRLAGLIAARVFRRDRRRAAAPLPPEAGGGPTPAARETFRRLRDHLGI
ncbi:hypothetical protein NBH00_03100 [Paraconexibacter antarcticus]|uniref:Uncharacterized protein n=1 Tax=Paraconexibacter antarcticus TaxID=2949664 RepID=A0ABY5DWA0_9ACTN|nr:hypothetical protein [Paraconexibacter antarcticus]UTI65204.1 hypothetical protein NBH00_03100 [Paraconexibacter antarcticus]